MCFQQKSLYIMLDATCEKPPAPGVIWLSGGVQALFLKKENGLSEGAHHTRIEIVATGFHLFKFLEQTFFHPLHY